MRYVIGCDIGSQSLKAVLISAEGITCGKASANYPIEYPQPAWAQQSPTSWMDALIRSVDSFLAHNGVNLKEIIALSPDAQVDGVVAVDQTGQSVYPVIHHLI